MTTTPQQLEQWMREGEGDRLEFKAARDSYSVEKLTRYCVALANERGGKFVLGVDDGNPRQVVGSQAFLDLERTVTAVRQRLRIPIMGESLDYQGHRVVVFHVPSRPHGVAIEYDGKHWARDGESLTGLSTDQLREIFAESGRDFSAEVCVGLTPDDLDPDAIHRFRQAIVAKTGNQRLLAASDEQLLRDVEVIVEEGVTNAALILFGKRPALRKHLAQAELVFEYRSNEASGPAQDREDYQSCVFDYLDDLWERINRRNDKDSFQFDTQLIPVATFDERTIREVILNAIAHRDYQLGGNVYVRQYQRRIEVTSPGGLPLAVNLENILYRSSPRNRRIADLFLKCAMVERSGQGVNLMFETAIRQSNRLPDFRHTDAYQVGVIISGEVTDKPFLRFLRGFDENLLRHLGTEDWLAVDRVRQETPLPDELRECAFRLLELGLVVRGGQGQFILAEAYYRFSGKLERFERLRARERLKEQLIERLTEHTLDGVSRGQLDSQLDQVSYADLGRLLAELATEQRIHSRGEKKGTRWFPGPLPEEK